MRLYCRPLNSLPYYGLRHLPIWLHDNLEGVVQDKTKGLDVPRLGVSSPSGFCSAVRWQPYLPILNTLVPQVGQTPWVAGLLFFMTMLLGFLISFLARHFIQYACI